VSSLTVELDLAKVRARVRLPSFAPVKNMSEQIKTKIDAALQDIVQLKYALVTHDLNLKELVVMNPETQEIITITIKSR
jgi:hypothetical protein